MATSYNLLAGLSVSAAGGSVNAQVSKNIAPAGTHYSDTVADYTTAAFVAVPLGSIATLAYIYIENLDATNYIQVTADATVGSKILARINAGEANLISADPAATYGIKAHTGTVSCRIILTEA